ncbi:hypothetical protein ACROYT_G039128 [Oculina patagonica]
MENRTITDGQITASSESKSDHAAIHGRLHNTEGHGTWSAAENDVNPWLQIDLIGQYIATRVATQGSYKHDEWVTKYKLQYVNDGNNFQYYMQHGQTTDKEFDGNTDQNTVVFHYLNPPITARYIRFVPVACHGSISMRVELFGCTQGSCKHILDSGGSRGDGEYWIDPGKSGTPLKVLCDMTTDADPSCSRLVLFDQKTIEVYLISGGWLLVSNVVVDSSSSLLQFSVETSYRGISSYHTNKMFLTKSAMTELRTHLNFTQVRFHCSKQQGRTFHVTTVANSTGEAVVQYFSGQTDVLPDACGSFVRMENDNSLLAGVCNKWGIENDAFGVGKWGHQNVNEMRLYNHAAFAAGLYHWMLTPGGPRWECDDFNVGVSPGDFWKVFVR